MGEADERRMHWSFWVIGVFALVWNLGGIANFMMQIRPEALAKMPEAHRLVAEARPLWATVSFAISVFGGATGSLLMMMRQPAAAFVFSISLIFSVAVTLHAYGVEGFISGLGTFEVVLTVIMPVVLAAFLVWYSRRVINQA